MIGVGLAIALNIAVDIFTGTAMTDVFGHVGAVLISLASVLIGVALAH